MGVSGLSIPIEMIDQMEIELRKVNGQASKLESHSRARVCCPVLFLRTRLRKAGFTLVPSYG